MEVYEVLITDSEDNVLEIRCIYAESLRSVLDTEDFDLLMKKFQEEATGFTITLDREKEDPK